MMLSEAALECHVEVEVEVETEARPTIGSDPMPLETHCTCGKDGTSLSKESLIQLHHAILLSSHFAVSIDLPNKTNSEALIEVALAW